MSERKTNRTIRQRRRTKKGYTLGGWWIDYGLELTMNAIPHAEQHPNRERRRDSEEAERNLREYKRRVKRRAVA